MVMTKKQKGEELDTITKVIQFFEDHCGEVVSFQCHMKPGHEGPCIPQEAAHRLHEQGESESDQAVSGEPGEWKKKGKGGPAPHAQYEVWRKETGIFVATPCYGMHAPWWVPRTVDLYSPGTTAFPMEDDDLWRPWTETALAPAEPEGAREALEKISVLHDYHVAYLDACSMADDMGHIAKKALAALASQAPAQDENSG